jgi:hypothetical protein
LCWSGTHRDSLILVRELKVQVLQTSCFSKGAKNIQKAGIVENLTAEDAINKVRMINQH